VNPGLIPLSVSEIFQYIQEVGRLVFCRIFWPCCAYADYTACRARVPSAHLVHGNLQRNAAGPFEPSDGGPHPPRQVRTWSLSARCLPLMCSHKLTTEGDRPQKRFFASPLQEEVVTTEAQVWALIARGAAARQVGETDYNARSSRSHSVFQVVCKCLKRKGHATQSS
jgi:hypothetical protein